MILFFTLLFVVAFLYASVGHGGASGYIALMAIYSISPEVIKPTALLLNIFVSSVAFIQFYRGSHFKFKTFLPFALASIPLSFIGGLMVLDGDVYKKILGLVLLIPIARFLFFKNAAADEIKPANFLLSLFIGGVIGLLSGMLGIGGGIILSPILLLLKWTDQKQTAAISAIFILVNSLSGLAGQLTKGFYFETNMLLYVAVAFTGGMCGSYFGSLRFDQNVLKRILAIVLIIASGKLLFS